MTWRLVIGAIPERAMAEGIGTVLRGDDGKTPSWLTFRVEEEPGPTAAPLAEGPRRRGSWIVFDGPPGPEPGRFVEVEDQDGRGAVGSREWRNEGELWALGPFDASPAAPVIEAIRSDWRFRELPNPRPPGPEADAAVAQLVATLARLEEEARRG